MCLTFVFPFQYKNHVIIKLKKGFIKTEKIKMFFKLYVVLKTI